MRSAGHHLRSEALLMGYPREAQQATPESIQTSIMSGTRDIKLPHSHFSWIESTQCLWRSSSLGSLTAFPLSSSIDPTTVRFWHDSHIHIGSGAPQYRCREMTQSLAPASQSLNLFEPAHSGVQRIFLFSESICLLNFVTAMNHCSVALRIRGVLHRQQCG